MEFKGVITSKQSKLPKNTKSIIFLISENDNYETNYIRLDHIKNDEYELKFIVNNSEKPIIFNYKGTFLDCITGIEQIGYVYSSEFNATKIIRFDEFIGQLKENI